MTNKPAKINRWNARGHSFALLGLAAMHRAYRARCLDQARQYGNTPGIAAACFTEASRHAADARRFIRNSAGFGRSVVLP